MTPSLVPCYNTSSMNEQTATTTTNSTIFESEKTLELLREIGSNPNLTQRYLSEKYGISLGKTNFLLQAFLERGFIKVNRFKNSKNKAGYAYLLTPEGVKARLDLIQRFLAIKLREYEALKKEIDAIAPKSQEAVA